MASPAATQTHGLPDPTWQLVDLANPRGSVVDALLPLKPSSLRWVLLTDLPPAGHAIVAPIVDRSDRDTGMRQLLIRNADWEQLKPVRLPGSYMPLSALEAYKPLTRRSPEALQFTDPAIATQLAQEANTFEHVNSRGADDA